MTDPQLDRLKNALYAWAGEAYDGPPVELARYPGGKDGWPPATDAEVQAAAGSLIAEDRLNVVASFGDRLVSVLPVGSGAIDSAEATDKSGPSPT